MNQLNGQQTKTLRKMLMWLKANPRDLYLSSGTIRNDTLFNGLQHILNRGKYSKEEQDVLNELRADYIRELERVKS